MTQYSQPLLLLELSALLEYLDLSPGRPTHLHVRGVEGQRLSCQIRYVRIFTLGLEMLLARQASQYLPPIAQLSHLAAG
jgi:hypothetical protein